ncbi:HAMP domain-containing histidine kinase [Algoriphagus aestuariicola]|uniref:histidine kinase n=1 Tax=Algoriphagus aestuariicola TaxID=1852016 RepID=A0ABS3BLJ5_9BACT|nr:HAMP domain-containing sensor histidine kinase [Algoriphagus aestuariicola]MBN7800033.1 HAMP domain-containing histidine kinase [Algoriphagus aestuariicola]
MFPATLNFSDQSSLDPILPSGFSEREILQMIFDQSEDILILTNASMEVEFVSQSLQNTLEIPVKKAIGKKVDQILENFPSLPLMKPNQKMVIPVTTPKTKKKFLIEFEFKPQFTQAGAVQSIIAIGRNVTEREVSLKKFKDIAFKEKELNQLKSRFVSMASHEFRTPLATILSSALLIDMLLKKDFTPEIKAKVLNHVDKIVTQTNRLTDITSDVLLLEKSIQPEMKISLKKILIGEFLKDLVDTINRENFERRTVAFSMPEKDVAVWTDPSLLVHIFRNLILNALKYSEGSLEPEVSLQLRGSYFEVSVKDYGLGIPKEEQEQIFGSFYRAKNVGNIKGTGLGLNIVRELTKKLNGEIWFKSSVGIGSEFFVSFPIK